MLVVGDPGDPATGMALEGARQEAELVANLFRELGLDVVDLIGPPGHSPTAQPASRLEVLRQLTAHNFDILHYAGHGAFDIWDPNAPGGSSPTACSRRRSSRSSTTHHGSSWPTLPLGPGFGRAADPATEVGLLPSLADEFFKRGVRDYIGAAWAIDDAGSIEFATTSTACSWCRPNLVHRACCWRGDARCPPPHGGARR